MAVIHTFISKNGKVTKKLTRATAIYQKCLECSGWNSREIEKCPAKDCALWPYRNRKATQKWGKK